LCTAKPHDSFGDFAERRRTNPVDASLSDATEAFAANFKPAGAGGKVTATILQAGISIWATTTLQASNRRQRVNKGVHQTGSSSSGTFRT
jgi:hypothetical protein